MTHTRGTGDEASAHPFSDQVRHHAAAKSVAMRRQGFFGAAMLPMSEFEYAGVVETLEQLVNRFELRVWTRLRRPVEVE